MLNSRFAHKPKLRWMFAFRLALLLTAFATSIASHADSDQYPQRTYRAWTGGDFWKWPAGNWTFWSPPKLWAPENTMRRYGAGLGRYDQEPIIVAHRGLVSSAEGKLENTVSAVLNASANGLFAVEIDVQADKNGVAWPLHDKSALRPFLIKKNLDEMTTGEVEAAKLVLVHPESALDAASGLGAAKYGYLPPQAILNDEQLLAVYGSKAKGVSSTSSELVPVKALIVRAVAINDRMSIFLDPKNYKSAVATMVAAVQSGFAERVFMKTYDAAWASELNIPEEDVGRRLYWDAMNALWGNQDAGQMTLVKIAPVFNLVDCLKTSDKVNSTTGCYQAAENRLRGILVSWGEHFEVQAVEMPGAYFNAWVDWVEQRYKPLVKGMATSIYDGSKCANDAYTRTFPSSGMALKRQPIRDCQSTAASSGGTVPIQKTTVSGYAPLPSTGYRFADFTAGGHFTGRTASTPFGAYSYTAFEYQMNGLPKPSTSDAGRRTICAQMYNVRKVKASYVVSDYPIQEMQCNYYFELWGGDHGSGSRAEVMGMFFALFRTRFPDQLGACAGQTASNVDISKGLGARPDCWSGDDRIPMSHLDFFSKYTEGALSWIGTNL